MKKLRVPIIIVSSCVVLCGIIIVMKGIQQASACTPSNVINLTYASSVKITNTGSEFSPSCIRIKANTQIIWSNSSSNEIEIGSDPQPLPITKKAENKQFTIKIPPAQTAAITMTKTGKLGYHNHHNFAQQAIIIVE